MLVKLAIAVKFTNILCATFLNKSFTCIFLCLKLRLKLLWRKKINRKAALKMLVKLTAGFHIIDGSNFVA